MRLLANSDEYFRISLDKGGMCLVIFSFIFRKSCGFDPPFIFVQLFVRKSVIHHFYSFMYVTYFAQISKLAAKGWVVKSLVCVCVCLCVCVEHN